ncbi:MAG: hypothetical protein J5606_07470, partial [Bacteroidales bacterium]|nr:hypothetical protein [Bacteroidales bacterium]
YNINFGNNVIPKYSFNAKELDEETGMYYYEARYYAPPTFTSRDPLFEKYFWISPYSYCANNPIKYMDPSGCTIVIIGEDGTETTYEPGMTYEGNDEFTQKAITVLNDGYSNSATAERMIGELCGPEYLYKIESGVESDYTPSNQSVIQKYGSDEVFYEKGGGVIKWNTSGMGTFEQDPQGGPSILKKRPSISLYHELGHAWDNMAGLMAGDSMKFQDLEVNEWTATRTENMIRQELGIPLRTWYYKSKSGGPMFPRLLDRNGNYKYTQYQH